MSANKSSLTVLALEITANFDALSIACAEFEEVAKQRYQTEEKECCRQVISDLVSAMGITRMQLFALARVFQFFRFDQAALEAIKAFDAEEQLDIPMQQNEQN